MFEAFYEECFNHAVQQNNLPALTVDSIKFVILWTVISLLHLLVSKMFGKKVADQVIPDPNDNTSDSGPSTEDILTSPVACTINGSLEKPVGIDLLRQMVTCLGNVEVWPKAKVKIIRRLGVDNVLDQSEHMTEEEVEFLVEKAEQVLANEAIRAKKERGHDTLRAMYNERHMSHNGEDFQVRW